MSDSDRARRSLPLDASAEALRRRLFGIAYRMIGDVHDAEDLVQEALLRWHLKPRDDVDAPEAWLVAVTTRLAIDRLRRAATERAAYAGPWLPTPVAPERFETPPDRSVEAKSDLSMAFLVLLERLAPEERAAFLLREVFDKEYGEIARILEKSAAATRQIVHRARARVRADRKHVPASPRVSERLFERLRTALEEDDADGLLRLLAEEVRFTSDGGGKAWAALRVVRGAERVVRLLRGVESKYPRPFDDELMYLNGEPALVRRRGEKTLSATFIATDGERISAIYRVVNPDKLQDIRVTRPPQ